MGGGEVLPAPLAKKQWETTLAIQICFNSENGRGEQEVSSELILKLSMIFIVSLQWHRQIMTLCYCTNKAGSSFSNRNNYSIIFCLSSTYTPFLCRQWVVVCLGLD